MDHGNEGGMPFEEAVHIRVPALQAMLSEILPDRHTCRRVAREHVASGGRLRMHAGGGCAAMAPGETRAKRGRVLNLVVQMPVEDLDPGSRQGLWITARPFQPKREQELDSLERALDEVSAGLPREQLAREPAHRVGRDLTQRFRAVALLHGRFGSIRIVTA